MVLSKQWWCRIEPSVDVSYLSIPQSPCRIALWIHSISGNLRYDMVQQVPPTQWPFVSLPLFQSWYLSPSGIFLVLRTRYSLSLRLKSKRQRHVVDSIGGRRRQTSQFQQLREMLPAATEVPLEATAVAMAKTMAYLSINGYTTRLSQQLKRPVADPSFCHPNNVSGQWINES